MKKNVTQMVVFRCPKCREITMVSMEVILSLDDWECVVCGALMSISEEEQKASVKK